ncbi:MAG: hypothetical protein CMH22_06335 [Methylophaga sp.]|nr:hypothetical protein [Methylophaga sp.]|tara:strand:- start:20370 stop:21032 length:663 start_codon:yes stop_codon:yes gene_type:complete
MLPEIAYQKFIVKINKNAQTDNISCDKGRFVLLYNENQNKIIEQILEDKSDDDLRYIEKLLVSNAELLSSDFKFNSQLFKLPTNFFDHSTLFGYATCEVCEEPQKIDLFEIKADNENFILSDEHNRPSFNWREAPYYFSENKVKVFTDNFTFTKLLLTYYRYPTQISLQNSEDPESDFTDTQIELDDKIVDRIISLAASDFELNNNNQKFQADIVRAKQK